MPSSSRNGSHFTRFITAPFEFRIENCKNPSGRSRPRDEARGRKIQACANISSIGHGLCDRKRQPRCIMMLASSMLGLRIAHPFVAGASPLGRDLDTIRRLEDGGAAAIVLPSLFEEQVTFAVEGRIRHMDPWDKQWSGYLKHFPHLSDYAFSVDEYAEHVARARRAVSIP